MKTKLLILFISILIFSCSGESNDISPPAPTSGNIFGSVNLYDEGTSQIDNSGMTISVEGTAIQAISDAAGDFTLMDVPFGTYTIVYEKTGYGTFKKFNVDLNILKR